MDPNTNLQEQLELAASIAAWDNDDDTNAVDKALAVAQDAHRLSELVLALDGWVTKGGFFPARWTR